MVSEQGGRKRMDRYIAFFHEIGLEMLIEVGGKGANLGELTRRGFRVPPGFCVCVSAWDEFLRRGNLGEPIRRLSSQLDCADLRRLEEETGRIRGLIESAEIPPTVEDSIRKAWQALAATAGCEPQVAVRSSVATRDGRRSSFPGQMDTYHNLRGIDQVLARIRSCWASAWTSRAVSTRLRLGLGPFDVMVAPLVQIMIPCETAGVMFTANPITGERSEVVINAAFGLGEAVVSGSLTPDQFIFEKVTGQRKSSEIGRKEFMSVVDGRRGWGTARIRLADAESRRPCLTEVQLVELVETGVRVEQSYGGVPQDIEWGYYQGELHILQARRIAALERVSTVSQIDAGEPPDSWECEFDTPVTDPPSVYTSANISEVLPGVLTPLTSGGLKALDYGFWKPSFETGVWQQPFPENPRDLVFVGLFYGRPHLNLSRFREVVARIPGGSTAEIDRTLPGEEPAASESGAGWLSPRALLILVRFLLKSLGMLRRVPRELVQYTARVHEDYEEFRRTDLSSVPLAELLDWLSRHRDEGLKIMSLHIENSALAVTFYEFLRRLCRRWLRDETGAFCARLTTGLASLESAKPNKEIYTLQQAARAVPELKRVFLSSSPRDIEGMLGQLQSQGAADFRARMREFLARFGYRGVGEAELMLPSWDQDPSFVFSVIANLLRAENPEDPQLVETRQAEDRQQATREAERRLPALRREVLRRVLRLAQTYVQNREQSKALLMMGVHGLKRIYGEISRRLGGQGLLKVPDDLYFLTEEEVLSLCRGEELETEEKIRRRRREWEWSRKVTLPETFRGRPKVVRAAGLEPAAGSGVQAGVVLRGLGVSPGRVTGKARVILDPRQEAFIEKGEILVVPVTDTGWTPLFLLASAIVVDVGGLLSHGSIVAREYGIPGVLNVRDGTKRIQTGDTVTVDGGFGEVVLHTSGPEQTVAEVHLRSPFKEA